MSVRLLLPALLTVSLAVGPGTPTALGQAGHVRTSGSPNLSGPSLLGSGDSRSRRMPGSLLNSYGPLQDAARSGPVWATNPQPVFFSPIVYRSLDVGLSDDHERREREAERRALEVERRLLIEERARLAAEAARPAPPVVVVTPIAIPSTPGWRPERLPEVPHPAEPGPTTEAEDPSPALLRLSVVPADAQLRLDGRLLDGGLGPDEILELRPGVHVVEAIGPGGERRRVIFGLSPGADRHVEIDLGEGSRMSEGDAAPFRRVARR